MSLTLTSDFIQGWIRTKLGGSGRVIELQDIDYVVIVSDAFRRFCKYVKKHNPRNLEYISTSHDEGYMIQLENAAVGVSQVEFMSEVEALRTGINLDEFRMGLLLGKSMYLPSDRAFDLQSYRKLLPSILKTYGLSPSWVYNPYNHQLILFAPAALYSVTYEVLLQYTDPTDVEDDYDDLVLRLCLRYAKETLGRIRGKFGNTIEGPSGNIMLDGETLLNEAKSEEDGLKLELEGLLDVPLPVIG